MCLLRLCLLFFAVISYYKTIFCHGRQKSNADLNHLPYPHGPLAGREPLVENTWPLPILMSMLFTVNSSQCTFMCHLFWGECINRLYFWMHYHYCQIIYQTLSISSDSLSHLLSYSLSYFPSFHNHMFVRTREMKWSSTDQTFFILQLGFFKPVASGNRALRGITCSLNSMKSFRCFS